MGAYEQFFNIEFGDVGANNQLTTKAIFRFLQEIAGIHSSLVGYGLNDMPRTHLTWVLLNWKLEIYQRPIWHTKIRINTWPRVIKGFYSYREFQVYDAQDNLIALASSKWLLFDIQKEKIAKLTPEMIEQYACVDRGVFEEPIQDKLKEPEDMDLTFEYTIQRRDIDTNHHTNNLSYLDFAYEALPKEVYDKIVLNKVEIMYKRESLLGDDISCFYKQLNEKEHYVVIKSKDLTKLHAILKFQQ